MAQHISYEESIKLVYKGLGLLAVITVIEVLFSLAGKGHIPGLTFLHGSRIAVYLVGAVLIGLSLYKAKYIIFEFMHLGYEVKGLSWTILMPMLLLVWAIIAFFQEGSMWNERRQEVQRFNERTATEIPVIAPIEQAGPAISTDSVPMSDQQGVGDYDVDQ